MILIQVNQEFAGLRLDKFICRKFDISFGLAQKIIREKKVKVNGNRVDAAYKTQLSDQVEIFANLAKRFEIHKKKPIISDDKIKKFRSWIIFEDENLIAINKPSGLATQGGSSVDISVDDFLAPQNLQLVHRLDKDTSGILLLAKNSAAADFLTLAFKNKTIAKAYLALVCGSVKKESGVINIPLRKKILGKNEKVQPDFDEGKEAITEFKLLKIFKKKSVKKILTHGFSEEEEKDESYSLLELKPLTGRTHQLRVHCKEIGHPILNDVKYGGKKTLRKEVCKRLCLHAYKIEIADYFGKKLEIKTEMPEFIRKPIY